MSAVQRSSAADGFTVILWGAAAAVLTVISAIADFASTFTPDGLALTMRVTPRRCRPSSRARPSRSPAPRPR